MEFLPIMINRAGVLIASEVIRGMPELSCNPVSSPLRRRSPSLIHCSLLLAGLPANEEAVIDRRGQGGLCSTSSYRRSAAPADTGRFLFREEDKKVPESCGWKASAAPRCPPPRGFSRLSSGCCCWSALPAGEAVSAAALIGAAAWLRP